jgi:hypothetical protein
MTESTSNAVPGHAELRAQAVELRLHGLLAHWDELMGHPEAEQRVRQWLGWESIERANRSLDRRWPTSTGAGPSNVTAPPSRS